MTFFSLKLLSATMVAAALTICSSQSVSAQSKLPETFGEMQAAYSSICSPNFPSVQPAGLPLDIRYTFVAQAEGRAALGICADEDRIGIGVPIDSAEMALSILASREFEPFWATAERHWGNDLSKLRETLRRDARGGGRDEKFDSMLDKQTSRARASAIKLSAIGHYDEALEVLEAEIERLTTTRMLKRKNRDFDRALLATSKASLISERDGEQAAAMYLRDYALAYPPAQYRANLDINRAAFLAEAGEYVAARALIQSTYQAFRETGSGSRHYQIAGSNREFDWIMACALDGVGEVDAARPYIDSVANIKEERPLDQYLAATKASTEIKLRMYLCLDDADNYFDLLRGEDIAPLSSIWLSFQSPEADFPLRPRKEWVIPDDIIAKFEQRSRRLPVTYGAALQKWVVANEPVAPTLP